MSVIPGHREITNASIRLARLADLVDEAKTHLEEEFVRTDGAVGAARLSDGSRGGAVIIVLDEDGNPDAIPVTGVEATVIARARLLAKMAEINDDMDSLIRIITSCEKTCRHVIGTRVPLEVNRCNPDPAKPGYDEPLGDGGWHDPLCDAFARSATQYSTCDACRKRFDRWRDRRGLKPAPDERPVEHDSEVHYTDGVAHARPIRQGAS